MFPLAHGKIDSLEGKADIYANIRIGRRSSNPYADARIKIGMRLFVHEDMDVELIIRNTLPTFNLFDLSQSDHSLQQIGDQPSAGTPTFVRILSQEPIKSQGIDVIAVGEYEDMGMLIQDLTHAQEWYAHAVKRQRIQNRGYVDKYSDRKYLDSEPSYFKYRGQCFKLHIHKKYVTPLLEAVNQGKVSEAREITRDFEDFVKNTDCLHVVRQLCSEINANKNNQDLRRVGTYMRLLSALRDQKYEQATVYGNQLKEKN